MLIGPAVLDVVGRNGRPYELVVRAGADHVLSQWRSERDAHAIEWFRRHDTR